VWPVKRPLQLTSGSSSILYFQSFSISPTLKLELLSFLMYKILQILQVGSLKHKAQLYILDQLQNPIGLQVINSGTNSNLNFKVVQTFLKKSDKFSKIPSSHVVLEYAFTLTHLYSNIGSSFTSGKKYQTGYIAPTITSTPLYQIG
jgi:hypothetical protein